MVKTSPQGTFFCQKGKKVSAKGRSPPQDLELGPCCGPDLLVTRESSQTKDYCDKINVCATSSIPSSGAK